MQSLRPGGLSPSCCGRRVSRVCLVCIYTGYISNTCIYDIHDIEFAYNALCSMYIYIYIVFVYYFSRRYVHLYVYIRRAVGVPHNAGARS